MLQHHSFSASLLIGCSKTSLPTTASATVTAQAPPQVGRTLAVHRQHRTSPVDSTTAALKASTATARPCPHSNTAVTVVNSSMAVLRVNTVEVNSTAKASTAPRRATVDSPNSTEATGNRAQVVTAHKVSIAVISISRHMLIETAGYGGPAPQGGAQSYYGGPQNYDNHQHNQYGGAPQYGPPPGQGGGYGGQQGGGYGGHPGGHGGPQQPGW